MTIIMDDMGGDNDDDADHDTALHDHDRPQRAARTNDLAISLAHNSRDHDHGDHNKMGAPLFVAAPHNNNDDDDIPTSSTSPAPPTIMTMDDWLTQAVVAGNGAIRSEYSVMFWSLAIANSSDAAEILCWSNVLPHPAFQHMMNQNNNGSNADAGLVAAMVFLGMLLGGLLVGALGDVYGRRRLLLLGLGTNTLAGLLSATCPNGWTLAMVRLVAGVGIGATVPPLFALAAELAAPPYRGYYVALVASFWMVGSVYVAIMAWLLLAVLNLHWRWFLVVCVWPSALGGYLVHTHVPESPRYLVVQRQYAAAVAVLATLAHKLQYHGRRLTVADLQAGYPPAPPTPPSWSQLESSLSPRRDMSSLGRRRNYTWCDLLWHSGADFVAAAASLYRPALWHTTVPLQVTWFSLSFGSYGLLTWINTLFAAVHLRNIYANALLFALANLPGNIISALLLDKVGRGRLLVTSIVLASCSLLVFAFVAADNDVTTTSTTTHNSTARQLYIVLAACSFQCWVISAWNAIDVLTSELFPTKVRATGLGLCTAAGRCGALLAQLVNGVLVTQPVRLLLVAAATLGLGALTPCWLPPERTGQAMVDDDNMGDGDVRTSGGTWPAMPTDSTRQRYHAISGGEPDALLSMV